MTTSALTNQDRKSLAVEYQRSLKAEAADAELRQWAAQLDTLNKQERGRRRTHGGFESREFTRQHVVLERAIKARRSAYRSQVEMLARALRESVPSEVRAVFDRARVAIDNHVRQALEADKADRLLRDTTEVRSPGSYKSVESYKSRMPSIKAILDGAPHFRRQVRYLELEALTVLEAEKRVASILAKMPQLKIDSMRWSERSKTFIAA